MAEGRSLYEEDFVRWSQDQAEAIRAAAASGANLPLDWENLAEEIDSLGRSQRSELRSRINTVIEHLLKLRFSSAVDPRAGWIDTIDRERDRIELALRDSPSLGSHLDEMVQDEVGRARRFAIRALDRHGEVSADLRARMDQARFTTEHVVGDWFPD